MIDGIDDAFETTKEQLAEIAARLLPACGEAGRIYRHILERKAGVAFVTEVSMDETGRPQTPFELLVTLAALADEQVPAETIAPRFCGEFHKGVDYEGDGAQFEREFRAHLAVIRHAVGRYALPATLKLSVHSGSDKFSIYAPIRRVLADTGAGLHLKTAGTTWLEELIGLAEAGGAGLALAKEVYAEAYARREECARRMPRWCGSGRRGCPSRRKYGRGRRRSTPARCGTSRPTRSSTPTCGSCCTWATRSRPKWARGIRPCWRSARNRSRAT